MFNLEAEKLTVVNILRATEVQLAPLADLIKESGGKITIPVHPYYKGPLNKTFPLTDPYLQATDALLQEAAALARPVVIMESTIDYHLLARRLPQTEGILYAVPTLPDEPTPAVFGGPGLIYGLPFIERYCWWKLASKFRRLGVSEAEVGGRYMLLHPPVYRSDMRDMAQMRKWADGKNSARYLVAANLIPEACAGSTVFCLLREGFDVGISSVSSPTNRLEPTDSQGLMLNSTIYPEAFAFGTIW